METRLRGCTVSNNTFIEWVSHFRDMDIVSMETLDVKELPPIAKQAFKKVFLEKQQEVESGGISAIEDPPTWCETFLVNPNHPERPLKLYDYQVAGMRFKDKGKKALFRWGRRTGKSTTLAGIAIWWAATKSNQTIIVVSGRAPHVMEIFDKINSLVGSNSELQKSFVSKTKTPYFRYNLSNGSSIRGFVGGVGKAATGDMVRGQSADLLIIDESDLIGKDALENSIMPIASTRDQVTGKTATLIMSSTPTGKRELFYRLCMDARHKVHYDDNYENIIEEENMNVPDNGWTEYYFPSHVVPGWLSIAYCQEHGLPMSRSDEHSARQQSGTEDAYLREYLAQFGEEVVAIFQNKFLDDPHITQNYEINKGTPNDLNIRIMGVDSNGAKIGTHLLVVEQINDMNDPEFGRFRLIHKDVIKSDVLTQRVAAKAIVELDRMYNCAWIYGDQGYGSAIQEFLHEWTLYPNPEIGNTDIGNRTVFVEFQKKIEYKNILTGETIKTFMKPYLVNHAASFLETGRLILPKSEDHKDGLIGHMRNFYREKISPNGNPTYTDLTDDHSIIAYILALFGFLDKYREIQTVSNQYIRPTSFDWANAIRNQMPGESRLIPGVVGRRVGRDESQTLGIESIASQMGMQYSFTSNETPSDEPSKRPIPGTNIPFKRGIRGVTKFGWRSI